MDGADPPVGANGGRLGVGVGANQYAAQLPARNDEAHHRKGPRHGGGARLRRCEADRRERAPRLEGSGGCCN